MFIGVHEKHFITAFPLVSEKNKIVDLILLSEISSERNDEIKEDLSGVPVVVMAGGRRARLYPYTKILPKPLIPIGDTPIVERIINRFTE